MSVRSGIYRHRIELQDENATADAQGHMVPSWTAVKKNIPAYVRAVSGREGLRGLQVDATTTHIIDLRYRTDVTNKRRFTHNSQTLNITKIIDPDGLKRRLIIECEEAT